MTSFLLPRKSPSHCSVRTPPCKSTKARQDLREERKVASKQEQINKRKVDELEGRVLKTQSSIAAYYYYEGELEKDKDRRERQVQVERKKAEKQVTNVKKSVVKEYEAKLKDASLDIKHKDKVIERLHDINEHNESLALSSLQQQKDQERHHKEVLADLKVKASAAISNAKKESAATTSKVCQCPERARGTCRRIPAAIRGAKVPALEATAKQRLNTNKKLKDKVSTLKDELEETREDMQSLLDEARQDISVLQEQLH
eukprot:scaffold19448_cov53-Cyclotella_meneghiniana.AAC.2